MAFYSSASEEAARLFEGPLAPDLSRAGDRRKVEGVGMQ